MTADRATPDQEAGGSPPPSVPPSLRRALELLAARREEGSFLRDLCRLAVEAAGGAAAVILLPRQGRLRPAAWAGTLPPAFLAATFGLEDDSGQPFSQAYHSGSTIWHTRWGEGMAPPPWATALRDEKLSACLAVPLQVAGRSVGVLALLGPAEWRFSSEQQDLAELLAVVAAAGLAARREKEEGVGRRENETQSREAVAAAPGILWEGEAGVGRFQARLPGFCLIAADEALARLLGWPEADSLLREFVPSQRVAEAAAWERLLAQAARGRVAGVEVPFRRRDDTVATLRLWGEWDEARKVFAGVAVDVSRCRDLEEELSKLRQSHRVLKERYLGASLLSQAEQEEVNRELARERQVAESALAACEAGVAAFTREGRVTHWNRSLEALTGLRREEVLGRELGRVLPGLAAAVDLQGLRETQPLPDLRRPVPLHPGMPPAGYDALLTPLRDDQGEADGGLLVLRPLAQVPASPGDVCGRDIGERVGRGLSLPAPEEGERLRRERLEALGSLAASLARDFDQILGVMLGYTEMAQAALPKEDPARARLAQVLKAGRRGRDLVQQILAFSRPWERRPPAPGAQPEKAREEPGGPAPPRQARGRILLAAGEESQGALWREILHSLGFEVHLALNGQEALELLRTRPQEVDLLIADQDLAPLSGLDLAQEVWSLLPGLPVILSLDPLDLVTLERAKTAGVQDFALKPWSLSELTAALDRILPPPRPKGLAS